MDIYDVAVKLALIDGVSGGLTHIAQQFTNVRARICGTQKALLNFEAALNASWEWRGGEEILDGMADIIDAGRAILGQQALVLTAGRKQTNVAKLTAAAYAAAASVMAATRVSALTTERTLLGMFGNAKEGQAALPSFVKAGAVLTTAGRSTGAERQLAYDLKALDIQDAFVNPKIGQFDGAAFKAGMHELVGLSLAIGHMRDACQLMLFTPMAGSAAQGMSFAGYARTYRDAIASMGRTGGRGPQMLSKTSSGGDISKALADDLVRTGLVKPEAIQYVRESSPDILNCHGIVGWQELTTNAADWAYDVLFPRLAKDGSKGVPGLMQILGDHMATFAMPMTRDLARGIKFLTRGLRVGPGVLKVLAGADGRGGPEQRRGLFGAGSIGAASLKLLTGPTALFAPATGIDALGKALPSIPAWLAHFASKQAMDAALAKLMKLPGALGLLFDLGGDTNQPWAKEHPLAKAQQARAIMEFMAHHISAQPLLPTFVSPHRVNSTLPLLPGAFVNMTPSPQGASALPLPPLPPSRVGAPVQVTIHSAPNVTLPLPPMSPGDIERALQRALIQGLDATTLQRIADELAKREAHALDPLLQKAIEKHFADAAHKRDTHLKRRSFVGTPSFGRGEGPP